MPDMLSLAMERTCTLFDHPRCRFQTGLRRCCLKRLHRGNHRLVKTRRKPAKEAPNET